MSNLSRLKTFCRYVIDQQLVEDVSAFERQCGFVSNVLSNEEEIALNDYTIETICDIYPQLNASWIRTGEGDMLNYTISEDYNSEEEIISPPNRAVKSQKDIFDIDLIQDNEKTQSLVQDKKSSQKGKNGKIVNEESYRQSTFIPSSIHELENNIKESSRVSESGINYFEKEYQILLSAFPFNIRLFINKYLPTVNDYLKFINSKYQFSSLLKERDELNLFVKLYGIIYSDYPLKKYDGYEVYQQYQREKNNIESFKAKESSTPFAHYKEEAENQQNLFRVKGKAKDLTVRPKNKTKGPSFYSNGQYQMSDMNIITVSTYGYGNRLCLLHNGLLYQQSQHSKDHFYRADNSRPFISFETGQTNIIPESYSSEPENNRINSTMTEYKSDDTTNNQDKEENTERNSLSSINTNNNNNEMEKVLNEPIYTIPEEEKRCNACILSANVIHKSRSAYEVLFHAINRMPGEFLTINMAIFKSNTIQDIQKETYWNPGGIILGKFTIHHNINDVEKIIIFPSR